ncbi:MAG TPA: hypothetical protein VII38_14700 [Polyangia bacterium]
MKGRALLLGICLCLGAARGFGAARGSLDGLADALVARVAPARGDDVAVAVSAPAPKLAADLAALMVARLIGAGARSAAPLALTESLDDAHAAAQARAAGFEKLVRLRLDTSGGRLRAEGSVLAVPGELWSDEPLARAHLFAEASLDDELRAYLPAAPRPPARGWRTRTLALGDVDVLALAVGDVDGDGRPELVGATRDAAIAWHLEGGRAIELYRVPLAGRLAALRPRADLATVRVESGTIEAHASPFADGVTRAASGLVPLSGFSFPGLPGACALEPGVDWFTAASCGAAATLLPARFYTAVAIARGDERVIAAIEPPSPGGAAGTLWLSTGGAPIEVAGVGAQVALATLSHPQAGADVVVTTEPAEPGEPDAIVIRALALGAPSLHRIAGLPGEVRALAAGDLDGDGSGEIVAAIRDAARRRTELWIVD